MKKAEKYQAAEMKRVRAESDASYEREQWEKLAAREWREGAVPATQDEEARREWMRGRLGIRGGGAR